MFSCTRCLRTYPVADVIRITIEQNNTNTTVNDLTQILDELTLDPIAAVLEHIIDLTRIISLCPNPYQDFNYHIIRFSIIHINTNSLLHMSQVEIFWEMLGRCSTSDQLYFLHAHESTYGSV